MHLELSEAERELFDERAAVLEYEAVGPRPIAESDAIREVVHRRWLRREFRLGSWGADDPPPAGFAEPSLTRPNAIDDSLVPLIGRPGIGGVPRVMGSPSKTFGSGPAGLVAAVGFVAWLWNASGEGDAEVGNASLKRH